MPEVQARITKVTQDPTTGWGTIETDDAVVKKLQTKIAEKLQEAGALKVSGELALISYSEKASTNINPNTGNPYPPNRYYERAGSIEVPKEEPDDGIDVVEPTGKRYKTDPEDAWRMCLNKGGELAVATLPLMEEDKRDFETQKQIGYAWAKFFMFTPMPGLEELAFGGGNGFGAGDSPPPHGDDDIPF